MAFLGKVGNLLKQTIGKQISLELSPSTPSIFQAIRCMSSSKIFIGGLSYGTDDQSLREAFTAYGEVIEARVIMDRETGRSRGFGFVTYTSGEEASSAIQALDGQELHGRRVRVNYAADRAGGFRSGGGGYGGGGSYGGGGGSYGGGGGSYGGGGYGGGGSYGGAGSGGYGGDNFGSGGGSSGSYSSGGYGGSGASGSYGTGGDGGSSGGYANVSGSGNYGVAGSGGGSDNYMGSSVGGENSFAGGGYGSSGGMSYGGGDQYTTNNQSGTGENFRDNDDNDDEPDDYANKRA